MQKTSHRQNKNKQKIKKLSFSIDEAIQLLKTTANTKFLETAEAHINLNINPKYSDQQLKDTIILPNKRATRTKIAVLTTDNLINEAKTAGADLIGNTQLISDISNKKINFDLLIVTPDMMPQLAKLGKILGPKGLMPSLKAGTITTTLLETIVEFKSGKFEYKADKSGIVHVNFGRSDFSDLALKENLVALYDSIKLNKPPGIKGQYFKTIYICSTMGPSIKLDLTTFK
jgi:large subunit ribosomal protein L1